MERLSPQRAANRMTVFCGFTMYLDIDSRVATPSSSRYSWAGSEPSSCELFLEPTRRTKCGNQYTVVPTTKKADVAAIALEFVIIKPRTGSESPAKSTVDCPQVAATGWARGDTRVVVVVVVVVCCVEMSMGENA